MRDTYTQKINKLNIIEVKRNELIYENENKVLCFINVTSNINKTKYFVLLMLLVTLSIITIIILNDKKEINLDNVKLKESVNNTFALMLEQSDGTYEESTDTKWPSEGYTFNSKMSGCVDNNGNTLENALTYIDGIIKLKTRTNAMCYIYFDIDKTFAIYSKTDNSLRFYNNEDYKTIDSKDTYNDLVVTEIYTDFINETYTLDSDTSTPNTPWFDNTENIISVYIEENFEPINISYWFNSLKNVEYIDVSKLDVSKVKEMEGTFQLVGYNVDKIQIIGLDGWDTSNVTNLMVTFNSMGYNSGTFEIDLSNWDTSNVVNMRNTFGWSGYNSTTWSVGDISNWDTSKVETMRYMFHYAGYNVETINLDLSKWDTSNLTDMIGVFYKFGEKAKELYIGDLSNWDTSKVTTMSGLFYCLGMNADTFNIGDLSNWDTSNVTDMSWLFLCAGRYSDYWNIGDISKWDTSKVTNMYRMFYYTGQTATNWNLDLSRWDVTNVTSYTDFNTIVEDKVIAPTWVN